MDQWWRDGTIYQIYPRSFQDSDGDGVGDLPGIARRLPYLKRLGVDALWLSPIFKSPMVDFGYDVADYRVIDPLFGDMADFDRLLAAAHDHGLKLLLDFVPNHTSDQHDWFVESASSRDNPKRDWYVWRDPAPGGGPPNNWISNFGGSAWRWHAATGQYYYHAYLAEQPDLNWRNPDVRAAMTDVLRFWLDKGVDGFRVDVIWHLIKDALFRDNPPNPAWRPGRPEIEQFLEIRSADQPEVSEVVAELRGVIEEYPGRLLIGEIYLPVTRLVSYYGENNRGVHLPFNFQLIGAPWTAESIATLVEEYEAALPEGGWPNWVLSNHDRPRIAARVGEAQARIAAMLLLTLRGTPTIYYGDELGIGGVDIPPDQAQDPWAQNEPEAGINRDQARTPMQWSSAPHAGFSEAAPWLPVTDDFKARNVAAQEGDDRSMLALYRALLALRRRETALRTGAYRTLLAREPVMAFERGEGSGRLGVFLNFSGAPTEIETPGGYVGGDILLRADGSAGGPVGATIALDPDAGLIVRPPRGG